jgi:hypothetical protein
VTRYKSASLTLNYERTEFITEDGYAEDTSDEKVAQVDNLLKYTLDEYIRETKSFKIQDNSNSHALGLFSKHIKNIATDFVDNKQTMHPNLQLNECKFIFITPRYWGYHIHQKEIYNIFNLSKLTCSEDCIDRITIYSDLDIHFHHLQYIVSIRNLRQCLYCTFFVAESMDTIEITHHIDVFQSGTDYQQNDLYREDYNCAVINSKSIFSSSKNFDVMKIYNQLHDCLSQKLLSTNSREHGSCNTIESSVAFDIIDILQHLSLKLQVNYMVFMVKLC